MRNAFGGTMAMLAVGSPGQSGKYGILNCCETDKERVKSQLPVVSSNCTCGVVATGQMSLKLPLRSATVGTAWLYGVGSCSCRYSSEKKKRVLSFLVLKTPGIYKGPPIVAPKSYLR